MQKSGTVLTEIGERFRLVRQLLDQPVTQVEWIAVELRITLELMLLGCGVTTRGAISKVSVVKVKVKDVAAAGKLVREVNPDYWPRTIRPAPETTTAR